MYSFQQLIQFFISFSLRPRKGADIVVWDFKNVFHLSTHGPAKGPTAIYHNQTYFFIYIFITMLIFNTGPFFPTSQNSNFLSFLVIMPGANLLLFSVRFLFALKIQRIHYITSTHGLPGGRLAIYRTPGDDIVLQELRKTGIPISLERTAIALVTIRSPLKPNLYQSPLSAAKRKAPTTGKPQKFIFIL